MEHVSESRAKLTEADDAIWSAIFVLDCIVNPEGQRQDVARAIELYGAGNYGAAASLAVAMTKGRVTTSASQSISVPKSTDELKVLFAAARVSAQTSMVRSEKQLKGMAADVIAECGQYARMAALFRASELRDDGDPAGAALWSRVADIIEKTQPTTCSRLRLN